jgi:hypothetical protein
MTLVQDSRPKQEGAGRRHLNCSAETIRARQEPRPTRLAEELN